MKLTLAFCSIVVFLLIGCGLGGSRPVSSPPPPGAQPAPAPASDAISTLLRLHNATRLASRLPALTLDSRLASAAITQARDCAAHDRLTHTGADGSQPWDRVTRFGYRWSFVEENAAQQPRPPANWPGPDPRTPEWAFSGWMQSPGHKANILSPNVTQMGVGWADAVSGTRYWIVTLARP